jgi:hypothetical protein
MLLTSTPQHAKKDIRLSKFLDLTIAVRKMLLAAAVFFSISITSHLYIPLLYGAFSIHHLQGTSGRYKHSFGCTR